MSDHSYSPTTPTDHARLIDRARAAREQAHQAVMDSRATVMAARSTMTEMAIMRSERERPNEQH